MDSQIIIYLSGKKDGSGSTRSEKGKMIDSSNSYSEDRSRSNRSERGKTVDFSISGSEDDRESSRILCYVRKVFKEKLGDRVDHDNRKPFLLELTIRAALLDSDFVEIDHVSKTTGNAQRNWYLPTYYYTLPDIITSGKTETVKIKFQHLGQRYCRVYGCLVGGTMVHSVPLDKARLVLFASVVWANCKRAIVVMKETNKATKIQPNKEVLRIWRKIKDELVLPLLGDLCEKAGLKGAPCFMGLPDELKLKILELVHGSDLARVSCVNSVLRCLSSSEDLWERKFTEQFPHISFPESMGSVTDHKEVFASFWKCRILQHNRIIGFNHCSA